MKNGLTFIYYKPWHIIAFFTFSVLITIVYGFWPLFFWYMGTSVGLGYGALNGTREDD